MMKKFTKRLWEKKNSKKGFTLVELIVVLVILAILAAMMVPALLGWIDKAKEKEIMLEGRSVYLAAQTLASEGYAKPTPARPAISDIATLADVTATDITSVTYKEDTDTSARDYYTVTGIVYTSGSLTATYTQTDGWVITKKTS